MFVKTGRLAAAHYYILCMYMPNDDSVVANRNVYNHGDVAFIGGAVSVTANTRHRSAAVLSAQKALIKDIDIYVLYELKGS